MVTNDYKLGFSNNRISYDDRELDWTQRIYTSTISTDGHGKISVSPVSGEAGTIATLSNTASAGYVFSNYAITGATVTGNTFMFDNSDVTVRANYVTEPHYVNISGVLGNGTMYGMGNIYSISLPESFNVYGSAWTKVGKFDFKTDGKSTPEILITAYNGYSGYNGMSQCSSYYDYFATNPKSFETGYSASGLSKEIIIDTVYLRYDYHNTTSNYPLPLSRMTIQYASGTNGPWSTGTKVTRSDSTTGGYALITNLGVTTKDKLAVQMSYMLNDSMPYMSGTGAYSGSFSGRIQVS
jgi:hypothetical protein